MTAPDPAATPDLRKAWDEGFVAAMCKYAPRPAAEYVQANANRNVLARHRDQNPYRSGGPRD